MLCIVSVIPFSSYTQEKGKSDSNTSTLLKFQVKQQCNKLHLQLDSLNFHHSILIMPHSFHDVHD